MSGGNGTKYATLEGDKTSHLLDGSRTFCGIPVPAYGGAEWTYTEPEKVCAACTKAEEKVAELTPERAPFEEGTPLASDGPEAAPAKAKKK